MKRSNCLMTCAAVLVGLLPRVAAAGENATMRAASDSVAAVFSKTGEPALPENPGLDDYLEIALRYNPGLRASFQRWQSALENTGHVGKLPDPTVSYGYFVERVETRVGPQNQRIGIRQAFPWFGSLGAMKAGSLERSKSVWKAFQAKRLALLYDVKAAYYSYYYLGREIALTRENLELLSFWESVARTKYSVALKQHQDVIRAQVELGKLEDRLRTLESKTQPAAARLRTAVGLPPSAELPVPEVISTDETPVDRDRVLERALRYNPDIRRLSHRMASARAGVRVASKAGKPSFVVGIDYIETGPARMPGVDESGKDPLMISVGLSLPIWLGSNKARVGEARAAMRAAEYEYADARNQLAEFVDRRVFEYSDALRKTLLYRDGLVPKAEQSLNAHYSAYQGGETDFLNVLDAQRQLLDFQLMLEKSRTDLAIRKAALEMLTATPLETMAGADK